MWQAKVTPEDVRLRKEVSELAGRDWRAAHKIARSIKHPWYRCQSLAAVAEVVPERALAFDILQEALQAANEQTEPNRIVTVSSWPLKILVRLDQDRARDHIKRLLAIASTEPHSLRRGHALLALAWAAAPVPELMAEVVAPLVDAATAGHGWRTQRLVRDTARLIGADFSDFVPQLLAKLPDDREKAKLLEDLGASGKHLPVESPRGQTDAA